MAAAVNAIGNRFFMRDYGAKMVDAGYAIVPTASGAKYPAEYSNGKWWPLKQWQLMGVTGTPLALVNIWSNWPECGIGICCGGQSRVIGFDIDVTDAEISATIRRKVEEMLGETPLVRIGQAPKVMLLYRTTEPMDKITLSPIELLGNGNQLVSHGVHPKTGQPYHWPQESPVETPVESLPLVTPEQVEAAARAAYELVPPELRPTRLASADIQSHAPSGDTAKATPEAIREVLAHIPNPDLPWEDWKRVIMATFAASGGDEQAYFELLKWSRTSSKHNDEVTRREWTGCRTSPPRSLGFGTLHYLATQHGWVPPAGLAFNEDKDVSDVDISGFDAWPLETTSDATPVHTTASVSEHVIASGIRQLPTDHIHASSIPELSKRPEAYMAVPPHVQSPPTSVLSPLHRGVPPTSKPSPFGPVEWEGCFDTTAPREYLVKKLLPRTGLALLSGPSGAGKSFIAIDLAGALATASPFFGQRTLPGGTLILAAEGYSTLQERLLAYRRGKYSVDRFVRVVDGHEEPYLDKFPIAICSIGTLNTDDPQAVIAMAMSVSAAMMERFGVPLRLIVIDTFAAAFALQDENSSTEVTRCMKFMLDVANRAQVLVMPVVHHGKSEGAGVRGSSAFEASADTRLTVHYSKADDGEVSWRSVSLGKSRTEETGWSHNFRLEPVVIGRDADGEDIASCSVSDLGDAKAEGKGSSKTAAAERNAAVVAALEKVAAEGVVPDTEGWVPAAFVMEAYLEAQGIGKDVKDNTRRKNFARAATIAEEAGLVELTGKREDRKIRKVRTADVDPPYRGGPSVH